jgi:hypothetical protein
LPTGILQIWYFQEASGIGNFGLVLKPKNGIFWYFGKMAWPETKNMPKISFSLRKINYSEPCKIT